MGRGMRRASACLHSQSQAGAWGIGVALELTSHVDSPAPKATRMAPRHLLRYLEVTYSGQPLRLTRESPLPGANQVHLHWGERSPTPFLSLLFKNKITQILFFICSRFLPPS